MMTFLIRGDEIVDCQPMEECFESYLERWLNSSKSFSILLSRIQTIKWSHLSLVRVLFSIRTFSINHQNQALLNDEHVKLFSTLILTSFQTYAPVLRLSAYSSILDTVIHLLDWSISSTSTSLPRFFALFDRSTFLSKHYPLISQHFSFNLRQLQTSIESYLSSEQVNPSLDGRLFSLDTDLIEYRQIVFFLDLLDIHNTDILKVIFIPIVENIRTAHQRPYMSTNTVRRSMELFSGLVQEKYFHSTNFVRDWFASTVRLIVREGLDFIKMHAVNNKDLSHTDSFYHLGETTHGLCSITHRVFNRGYSWRY